MATKPTLDLGEGYSPSKPNGDTGYFNGDPKKKNPITTQPVTATGGKTTTPIVPKQLSYKDMSKTDSDWYNAYSRSVVGGNADYLGLQKYQDFSKKYGLKQHEIDPRQLHNLSIKALSGDTAAQQYLKNMNLNPKTGSATVTLPRPDRPDERPDQRQQLDQLQKIMQDGLQGYNQNDPNDPYNLYRQLLQQNQQGALNAQDVMLNNGMQQMDANSFQQFEQLQQMMAERGMGESGIAADAYMRAQMGNNQAYQQAFAESANTKANINQQYAALGNENNIAQRQYGDSRNDLVYDRATGQKQYNDAKSWQEKTYAEQKAWEEKTYADEKAFKDKAYKDSRLDRAYEVSKERRDYKDRKAAMSAEQKAIEAKLLNDAIDNQTKRDKYLTESTGVVYLDGKPLKGSDGKPIPSMAMQELMETNRHNQATEGIGAANANTNARNADTNAMNAQTKRDKALADVALKGKEIEIKQGTLDLNTEKYNLSVKAFNASVDKALVDINNKTLTNVVNNKKREAQNLLAQANAIKIKDPNSKEGKKLVADRQKLIDQYNKKNKEIEAEIGKYKVLTAPK